jgi:nucleoside-diphosphate-sugar epimerase
MKVLVVGATGAIGRPLVQQLVGRGHTVIGTTRSAGKEAELRAAGATPLVLDVLDREAVIQAIARTRPDVVAQEATALSGMMDFRKFDEFFAMTNRLRVEGTGNLLEGMRRAGVHRIVAQSYAGPGAFATTGTWVKTEEAPLNPDPPAAMRSAVEAMSSLERSVLAAEGIQGAVLRYGGFYGPRTGLGEGGSQLEGVLRRRFPIVGGGIGVWSFMHVHDGAVATANAIERGARGLYHVVDDEPARVAEWLPALTEAIGAKPPRHVPAWLGRMFAGELGVVMMTESRGASNEKAKRELGWKLEYPSWRVGFRTGLGGTGALAA